MWATRLGSECRCSSRSPSPPLGQQGWPIHCRWIRPSALSPERCLGLSSGRSRCGGTTVESLGLDSRDLAPPRPGRPEPYRVSDVEDRFDNRSCREAGSTGSAASIERGDGSTTDLDRRVWIQPAWTRPSSLRESRLTRSPTQHSTPSARPVHQLILLQQIWRGQTIHAVPRRAHRLQMSRPTRRRGSTSADPTRANAMAVRRRAPTCQRVDQRLHRSHCWRRRRSRRRKRIDQGEVPQEFVVELASRCPPGALGVLPLEHVTCIVGAP